MRYIFVVSAFLLSGCLFGGGRDGGEENNVVVIDNNGSTNADNNDVRVGEASVEQVDCTPNSTIFVTDAGVSDGFELDAGAVVAFTTDRARVGTQIFSLAAGWAKVVGSELRIVVGAVTETPPADATAVEPEQFFEGTVEIEPGTEVFGVQLDGNLVDADGTSHTPFELVIATSNGIKECAFTRASAESALVVECGSGLAQEQFESVDVRAAESLLFAPVFVADGDDYVLPLTNLGLVIAGAGQGPQGRNYLGLVNARATGQLIALSTSDAIQPFLEPPEVFAERFAWGVGETEGGWPAVMALARDPAGEDYAPRVLVKGEPGYVELELDRWVMPPDVEPSRRTFTFLDGYDASVTIGCADSDGGCDNPFFAVNDASRAQVLYGYAALTEDGQRLMLGRPGDIAGNDVIATALDGTATEVAAMRKLPVDAGITDAFPVIAVVTGEERDQVSLMQWNFSADVEVLPSALGGRFDDVQQFSGTNVFDGSGDAILVFRGREEGRYGVGLFRFQRGEGAGWLDFDVTACADR